MRETTSRKDGSSSSSEANREGDLEGQMQCRGSEQIVAGVFAKTAEC